MTKPPIYLDHAAATPLDPQVLAAMQPYLTTEFYNPSATYTAARQVATELEAARGTVAKWFGCRPGEVVFTAGGTEANNLAIDGVMRQFPDSNLVVSAIEHEAVLQPASHYERRLAPVGFDGIVDIAKLDRLIDESTVLVSVMYANNEVGSIQPLREIGQLIENKRSSRASIGNSKPLYFHTDACQATNYLDMHVARLGVDLMTINGGKMYGPKQSGALFVKAGVQLEPIISGGGQENGLRSGTENVAQSIGLATAFDIAQTIRKTEVKRLYELRYHLLNTLQVKRLQHQINGSHVKYLVNNVHAIFPLQDNERLLIKLDERGIQAAAGSACTASNDEPSHVLKAMGYSDELAQSSIRFTMGRSTTIEDIDKLVEVLCELMPPPTTALFDEV